MAYSLFFKYNKFLKFIPLVPLVPLIPITLYNNKHVFCEYDKQIMLKHELTLTNTNTFKKDFDKFVPTKMIGNNYNDFKYKLGLNANDQNFVPDGTCFGGGLYFVDRTDIFGFSHYGSDIAHIELINEEPIWIEPNGKCKTNKFYITKIEPLKEYLNNLQVQQQMEAVIKNYNLVDLITKIDTLKEYINNLPEKQQIEAVNENHNIIKLITNPSEKFLFDVINYYKNIIYSLEISDVLKVFESYPILFTNDSLMEIYMNVVEDKES